MTKLRGQVLCLLVALINRRNVTIAVSALAGCFAYLLLTLPAFVQAAPLSLWKIKHDQAVVYLVGSVHVLKVSDYPLPGPFQTAFDASQITVFEVDLDKASDPAVANFLFTEGRYLPPETLADNLLPESYSALTRYLNSTHQPIDQFKQLKPWAISLNIAMVETQRLGYDPQLGLDLHFQKLARQQGKPILELESIEDQLKLLSGDSAELQEFSLVAAIAEIPRFEALIDELMHAWRVGSADEMYTLLSQSYDAPVAIGQSLPFDEEELQRQLAEQMKRILDTRNHKMAEKIGRFLETPDTYFVVVGALHMGGPNGLLTILGEDHEIQQLHHSPD